MNIKGYITAVSLTLVTCAAAQQVELKEVTDKKEVKVVQEQQARVQIAILLDSSGSMSGLIHQARAQLWDVVNTFIDAKIGGKVPHVEVAFYTHGQGSAGELNDYIRRIQPLTRDLDQVSEDLFKLTTTGSNEHCGAVIKRATTELKWDKDPNVYKAIFIAGNETFYQGDIKASDACKAAIAKGIIVNTIFCGSENDAAVSGWKEAASLADGKFLVINQNKAVAQFEAPQDAKIKELNTKLNGTYITWNKLGKMKGKQQALADLQNAQVSSSTAVKRALSKSSKNYHNDSWDLVDACTAKDFDWSKIEEENLPEELKKLDLVKRKAYVETKRKERKEIQSKITALGKERRKFVSEKRKEQAEKDGKSLESVISKTVIEQATKKGYSFEKK